jgi:predicted RNase H-like nuclease (RuvC/YqgF family)
MACKNTEIIKTTKKIEALEEQVRQLQESHEKLKAHYHQFMKATVSYLKENEEE